MTDGVTRRGLFIGAAAGGLGAALPLSARAEAKEDVAVAEEDLRYPFYGAGPQGGIATPPQRYTMFMAFDLTATTAVQLQTLLARWSAAIAVMMEGKPLGKVEPQRATAIPHDNGEALDLGSAGLTVTVGLGPRVFGPDLGLEAHRPAMMRPLAALPGDAMKPEASGGDLSLQACAEDPQVAYHAIRHLARIAKQTGAAATRWTVMGFGRASAGAGQETPRNLFGFKDGTRNLKTPEDLDRHVWVKDGPAWTHGGSYQVVRKIEMHIENWDTAQIGTQNATFGRDKLSGAPMGGKHEFDTPDFDAEAGDGTPVIPMTSHMRLAAHETSDGVRILRRSYNYTDGLNAVGRLDAGLLFLSYQNDPAAFEHLQRRLGVADALNEYITHVGSGLFFVPPAPSEGSYIGAAMFA